MKKPIIIMIILLLVIIITRGVILFLVLGDSKEVNENDIDSILDRTISTETITTSLQDHTIVQVAFELQTDSKETKDELSKRMFQVKDIIINYFANKKAADIKHDEGIEELRQALITDINDIMQSGQIEKIYVTSYVMQ